MKPTAPLVSLLLCLPLVAQSAPDRRVDSASFGIGYGPQGYMVTTMRTGPSLGYFLGLEGKPDQTSGTQEEPGSGNPSWVQHKSTTGGAHLGLAFRLDSRWVVGLGAAYASTMYRYTYNPGANPSPFSPMPPAPGPLSESRWDLLAMVDVRLGPAWGIEVIGSGEGLGGAVTFRF
jgi:hypothetical protein